MIETIREKLHWQEPYKNSELNQEKTFDSSLVKNFITAVEAMSSNLPLTFTIYYYIVKKKKNPV